MSANDEQPLLRAVNIGRQVEGRWLFREVNFDLSAGEQVVVRGGSGVGKSVLLRSLALLEPLQEGAVHDRGGAIHGPLVPAFRAQVVYLHQQAALFEGTVAENLKLPFELKHHAAHQFDPERVTRWLQSLGRDDGFLDQRGEHLSGGEMQLVALVRAMQLDPHVLLLDEPTSSLDAKTASAVEEVVGDWLASAPHERAAVWVTHDSEQAERVATRTMSLTEGRLQ